MKLLSAAVGWCVLLAGGCADNQPETVDPSQLVGVQLMRIDSALEGHRVHVLLGFEEPNDLVFLKTEGRADIVPLPHTGRQSIRIDGTPLQLNIAALTSGMPFPSNWRLIGAYLRADEPCVAEISTIGEPALPTQRVRLEPGRFAPVMMGQDATRVQALMARIGKMVKDNRFAKSAVECALLDAQGKRLGLPVSELLGGRRRDRLPVAWTLASGDTARDIAEAERMLDLRRHNIFKLKIGARPIRDDIAHVAAIKAALGDRAAVRVDVNMAWSEGEAAFGMAALADAGCDHTACASSGRSDHWLRSQGCSGQQRTCRAQVWSRRKLARRHRCDFPLRPLPGAVR